MTRSRAKCNRSSLIAVETLVFRIASDTIVVVSSNPSPTKRSSTLKVKLNNSSRVAAGQALVIRSIAWKVSSALEAKASEVVGSLGHHRRTLVMNWQVKAHLRCKDRFRACFLLAETSWVGPTIMSKILVVIHDSLRIHSNRDKDRRRIRTAKVESSLWASIPIWILSSNRQTRASIRHLPRTKMKFGCAKVWHSHQKCKHKIHQRPNLSIVPANPSQAIQQIYSLMEG